MTNLAKNTETNVSTYEQSANDFLNKTGATIEISFLRNGKHFDDDKEFRDIYKITIKRGNRSMVFNFGNSINNSGFYYTKGKQKIELDRKYLEKDYFKGKALGLVGTIKMKDSFFLNNGKSDVIHYPKAPTNYDILACLQKYEVGTFDDFCGDFGYDTDSRKAEKIYNAVVKEYTDLCTLFSDAEIEEMKEIQ